ncbi:hypothetical protein NM208_g2774 [Fusarium decemcellulare]|uniref:Uncharacterized protein n=1 Tax=Fusarium decemcellulare TaxID=57161 RepID=A0ACC1SRA3_9HYPO|nr:hypothetical protein NM208_g2774 [Fusarium decemcellulare]
MAATRNFGITSFSGSALDYQQQRQQAYGNHIGRLGRLLPVPARRAYLQYKIWNYYANVAFPKPDAILPCGKSDYAFTLWAGEDGAEFRVMVYHDVGDSHADLRGWSDIPTACDNSHGTGPADEICTQDKPVTFKIDGPVGSSPDL